MKNYILFIGSILSLIIIISGKSIDKYDSAALKFSVMDTLNKYSESDSLIIRDDNSSIVLSIGKANAVNFAILSESDSTLVLYRKYNEMWIAADTVTRSAYLNYTITADLNGDGLKDISAVSLSGAAGNKDNTVYLFDKITRTFKHNKHYDLTNLTYDKNGKFIRSSWYAGAMHCQTKMKYVLSGDSLMLETIVQYCPDVVDSYIGSLIISQNRNGKMVKDSTSGSASKLWRRFENKLWDSTNE